MTARAPGAVLAAVALVAALASASTIAPAQGTPPVPPAGGGGTEPPPATLLYQNFPNPFTPSGDARTCIWFDLARPSPVELDVLDLRGRRVRRILPATGYLGIVPAGRYGRGTAGECDAVSSWDGRDEDGRVVPSGVYLLRMRADGEHVTRKIVVLIR